MIRRHKRINTNEPTNEDPSLYSDICIPSRIPGADLHAKLYPQWKISNDGLADQQVNHRARAIADGHLRTVAEKWSSVRLPYHHSATEIAINQELAFPIEYHQPIGVVITGYVQLFPVAGNESAINDYLEELRKEHSRAERTRDRLDFYNFVFEIPERAWLWWVDQSPEKLQALPADAFNVLLQALEDARAVQSESQTAGKDSFAQIISDFIAQSDPNHATLAIGLLKQYLTHFDRFDLIKRADQLTYQTDENLHKRNDQPETVRAEPENNDKL